MEVDTKYPLARGMHGKRDREGEIHMALYKDNNNMKLYRLIVPITNYMKDDIYEQDMFIMSSRIPEYLDWWNLALDYHNRDKEYPEYTNDWHEVLTIMANTKEFPQLVSSCMAQTNSFVEIPNFGNYPITVKVEYFKVLE